MFLSSTTVYPISEELLKEEDVNGEYFHKYFCVGNMKRFSEILCEMYSIKIKNPMTTIIIRPGNCFSSDTNIMTVDGIKNIKEIKIKDKIYTLNPKTFNIEISEVMRTIESNYNESVIIKNKRGIDWEITKDHNLFVNTRNFKYKFVKAGFLLNNKKTQRGLALHNIIHNVSNNDFFSLGSYADNEHYICVFPRKYDHSDHKKIKRYGLKKHYGNKIYYAQKKKEIKNYKDFLKEFSGRIYIKDNIINGKFFSYTVSMSPFISLLGWFLSEGNISRPTKNSFQVCIAQDKKNNINRLHIEKVIKECGFKYGKNKDRYYFSSRLFRNFIKTYMKKYAKNKKIPSFIFKLHQDYLKRLFNSLMMGDGDKDFHRYSTCSYLLAKDFFHLAFLLGHQPLLRKEQKNEKTIYRICMRKINLRRTFKDSHISIKKYNVKRKFYCITTDKNHIVYAGKNGCMGWIGQCYGPFDKFEWETSHSTAALIRRVIERHNPLVVWGDGNDLKDIMYISDFIDGIISAMEKIEKFDIINLASGKSHSIKETLETILEVDNYINAKIEYDLTKPTMIPKRLIDISKARKILNFEPKIDLKTGIKKTIDYYRYAF